MACRPNKQVIIKVLFEEQSQPIFTTVMNDYLQQNNYMW